ncbi:MAG: hypothetical protein ACOY4R_07970 [Pseudomonadota bacterium]
MFDRAACRDFFPSATTPHVSMAGLRALSDVLRDSLRRRTTASIASLCDASCASRNEDGEEARVSQHDQTPNEGIVWRDNQDESPHPGCRAIVLWKTFEMWRQRSELGNSLSTVLDELSPSENQECSADFSANSLIELNRWRGVWGSVLV